LYLPSNGFFALLAVSPDDRVIHQTLYSWIGVSSFQRDGWRSETDPLPAL